MTVLLTLLACGDKDPVTADSGATDGDTGPLADNQAPGAPTVTLSPEEPRSSEDLLCTGVSEDPDGDTVTYTYAWIQDGVDLGVGDHMLAGEARTPWTDVTCVVTASDGTLEGEPGEATTTSRDACNSVSFSSAGGYLLPEQDAADFAMDEGDFTLEAWVKPTASDDDQVLFSRGNADERITALNADVLIFLNTNDKWVFATGSDTCGNFDLDLEPRWGEWQHLAFVYEADRNVKFIYVDGEQVADCSSDTANTATTGFLMLGTSGYYDGGQPVLQDHFTSSVDEIRVSNSVRYTDDFTPSRWHEPDAETMLLYHFEEGQGGDVEDASGQGHHGFGGGLFWDATTSTCDG